MTHLARGLLLALVLAVPTDLAHANGNAPAALYQQGVNDSVPSSLGADGWAAEFGVVLPQRAEQVRREAVTAAEALPVLAREAIADLRAHLDLPRRAHQRYRSSWSPWLSSMNRRGAFRRFAGRRRCTACGH